MASMASRNYGITLAAMSQYAKEQGLSASSAMVTAMMNDAADGTLDGKMSGSQVTMGMGGGMGSMQMSADAGTTGMATAMTNFLNSSENISGLTPTDMSALINSLKASGGQL